MAMLSRFLHNKKIEKPPPPKRQNDVIKEKLIYESYLTYNIDSFPAVETVLKGLVSNVICPAQQRYIV